MAKGHYIVEGWRKGENVWWASPKTSPAALRHVEQAILDHDAAIVHVTWYGDDAKRGVEIAQVSASLIWKWHDCPEAKVLRALVQKRD